MLRDANPTAVIDRHEFCPYHPDASIERYRRPNSPLRKPSPGMLYSAAEALGLDLRTSWVIGDAARDIEAGHAAGCRTILFTDKSLKSSPAALVEPNVEPDFTATSLAEAIDIVAGHAPGAEGASAEEAAPPEHVESVAPASVASRHGDSSDDAQQEHAAPSATANEVSSPTPAPPDPDQPVVSAEKAPADEPPLAPPRRPWLEHVEARRAAKAAAEAAEAAEAATATAARDVSANPNSALVPPPKLESVASEILQELRRRREQPQSDFSVSKLLAGVVQVGVLAVLFMAFLNRSDARALQPLLLFALTLQTMTIALLIMGKQR
jgi:D-glycero-D-manno-heptose 1,7-bisphosphate phosphatase